MKKSFLLLFSSVLLFSCNNKQADKQESVGGDSLTTVVDDHNARTSLDVAGGYKGVLPTASAGGMEVIINLTDSTYSKEFKYLGEKNPKAYASKGVFSWSADGSTITLSGEDAPNQYFVEEGALRQLDIEGKKIEGSLADQYVLKKE